MIRAPRQLSGPGTCMSQARMAYLRVVGGTMPVRQYAEGLGGCQSMSVSRVRGCGQAWQMHIRGRDGLRQAAGGRDSR